MLGDGGAPDIYWVNVATGAKTLVDLGLDGVSNWCWGEQSADGNVTLIGIWTLLSATLIFTCWRSTTIEAECPFFAG
jgi:hypothetical protein